MQPHLYCYFKKQLWFRFILIFSLLFKLPLYGQTNNLNIAFDKNSINEVLTRLIVEKKINLSFDPAIIPRNIKITRRFKEVPVYEILNFIFKDTPLEYHLTSNVIVITAKKKPFFVIGGFIKDAETGEYIIGGSIFNSSKHLTSSNNYGYFALELPGGNDTLHISHLGYKKKEIVFNVSQSMAVNILLEKQTDTLKEVRVAAKNNDLFVNPVAGSSLNQDIIWSHLSEGGEPDLIKSVQLLNGIQTITEGSSSLFVRGGDKDQNLILLDEAPVYNPAHLFGLVSVFNPDAINQVQIYQNEIPANFGGRLSSVIDNVMQNGDNKTFHVKGGLSMLSARVAVEGPLVSDKGSYLFTFRKGFTNLLKAFDPFPYNANYSDFNLKLNYQLNTNNKIYLSGYYGFDKLRAFDNYDNSWGNKIATFRWNHLFNSRLFLNLSVLYSNYSNHLNIDADQSDAKSQWITGIIDKSIKADFTYYVHNSQQIKFGINLINHKFIPGESPSRFNDTIPVNIPRHKAIEMAAYFNHRFNILSDLQLTYGLRMSYFYNKTLLPNGPDIVDFYMNSGYSDLLTEPIKNFLRFEPRLCLQYNFNKNSAMKMVYNRNYQYLQLVQGEELAFSSLESWIPASSTIAPQMADFYSIGYSLNSKDIIFTTTAYLKKLYNQVELNDHAQIILNPFIESQLQFGKSTASGIEFSLTKSWKNITGNLGYTYSMVNKQIPGVNDNSAFKANYNIPHNLRFSIDYQPIPRISVNAFFTYKSGRPVTLPVGYYIENGQRIPIFEDRNTSHLPDDKRLDLTIELKPRTRTDHKKRWKSTWLFSIYNVLNQRNIIFYAIDHPTTVNNLSSGIVPSVTYNFKF